MCANCQLDPADLKEIEHIANQVSEKFSTGDIYPDYPVLVMTPDGAAVMHWGYKGEWKKALPKLIFNAKQEGAWTNSEHEEAMRFGRIVVPTTGFYEWKPDNVQYDLWGQPILDKKGKKTRHRFTLPGEKILYLPAIYKMGLDKDGETRTARFTIVTTTPNDSMIQVHDRMPVILRASECDAWMRDEAAARAIMTRVQPELIGIAA